MFRNKPTVVRGDSWREIPELFYRGVGLQEQVNPVGGDIKVVKYTEEECKNIFTADRINSIRNTVGKNFLVGEIDIEVNTFTRIDFHILIEKILHDEREIDPSRDTGLYYTFLVADEEGDQVNIRNMKNLGSYGMNLQRVSHVPNEVFSHKSLNKNKSGLALEAKVVNPGQSPDQRHHGKGTTRIMFIVPEGSRINEGDILTWEGFISYINIDVKESGFRTKDRIIGDSSSGQNRWHQFY